MSDIYPIYPNLYAQPKPNRSQPTVISHCPPQDPLCHFDSNTIETPFCVMDSGTIAPPIGRLVISTCVMLQLSITRLKVRLH